MLHDFAVTGTRVVFFDSPIVFDPASAAAGGPPFRWDDDHPTRVEVMPRDGGEVRWTDVEPAHLSHSLKAHDEGEDVVLVGTRLPRGQHDDHGGAGGGLPHLHRWKVGPSGAIADEPIDRDASEYPRIPDDRVGRPTRFGYTTSFALTAEPEHSTIY